MVRTAGTLAVVLLLVLLTMLGLSLAQRYVESRITLARIQKVAHLVTLKAPMQQIVEAKLQGYTGGIHCLVLAGGEALIGTDLEKATVSVTNDNVTLTLPTPGVMSCALDQAQTSVVFVGRTGLWWMLPGEAGEPRVIQQAMREAQQAMCGAAESETNIEAAREKAEQALTELLADGKREIQIEWLDGGER